MPALFLIAAVWKIDIIRSRMEGTKFSRFVDALTPDARVSIRGCDNPTTIHITERSNDTASGGGMNRYASDRIMLIDGDANTLTLDTFEGGSVAPGGPLPDGLGYQVCTPVRFFLPFFPAFPTSKMDVLVMCVVPD